jgi:phosphoribosyl-AMP cyclohydrolase / phosphoribosyl-ATP pyrophosphohydrolase
MVTPTEADLTPAIVQDAQTGVVLMLGYMNADSLAETKRSGLVTFYSRSKQRLWTKGETSGNTLKVQKILLDCDKDTYLIKAIPNGPICHTGDDTCFQEANTGSSILFLAILEDIIKSRNQNRDEASYTGSLFTKGVSKIAQKVGEEAVELVIEALQQDNKENFLNESADLLFHFLVLLEARGFSLAEVIAILKRRNTPSPVIE